MQIDFHHGVTYVLARLAGFPPDDAQTIAYSSQYVDDATNCGVIHFDNGALFQRLCSAHKMLDYRNLQELANHRVWLPFHFLPANDGLPPGQDPPGAFIEKLICRPNSHIAQAMVQESMAHRDTASGLHRLGITMHVYADTWAHQGFAGVNHRINEARDITNAEGKTDDRLRARLVNSLMNGAFALGHGAVLSNPDRPFLVWGYTNGRGERIERNNPVDFLAAAEHLCEAMQRYRLGDDVGPVPGLAEADRQTIAQLLTSLTDESAPHRHQQWLEAIAAGAFSFGPEAVSYIAKGKGSWKYLALGTERAVDLDGEVFEYRSGFLTSDWKYFHDALQAHRLYVLHDLLPRYGICAA
jgi:hypothetical protein